MKTREMEIVANDGAKSSLRIFEQDGQSPFVIIFMPAMGVEAAYYSPFAEALAHKGHTVVLADHRGLGTSNLRASRKVNFGYQEMIDFDFPAVVSKVGEAFPGRGILLGGHSLGGQLSVLYTALNPETIDGLVFVSSCTVYYKNWKFPDSLKILAGTQTASLLAKTIGFFPGKRIGFGGTEARQVINDWAFNGRTGKYGTANNHTDFEARINEINLPAIAISLEGDWFAPEKAVDHLIGKMGGNAITRIHLTRNDAGPETLNHFKWVRNSEPIVEKISAWIHQLSVAG